MLAQVDFKPILGIDAYVVRVEVDISSAVPMFTIVGLPDAAVQESRERVRSAIRNTGLEFPLRRITINLAPADIKKQGPAFDLPIAVGLLAATGQISDNRLSEGLFVGELALVRRGQPGCWASCPSLSRRRRTSEPFWWCRRRTPARRRLSGM